MRAIALFLLALASIGCDLTGPSESLTGHWIARSLGHILVRLH